MAEASTSDRPAPLDAPAERQPVPFQPVEGDREGLGAALECIAYRAAVGGLARLPRPLFRGLVAALARAAKAVDRRHAAAARTWLTQALAHAAAGAPPAPDEVERLVVAAYRHLVTVAVDQHRYDLRFDPADPAALLERVEVDLGDDALRALAAARAGGPGCVLVSAHCGDWEMAARISSAVGFAPLHVVSKPPRNGPMSRRFQAQREAAGVRLLPRRGAMQFAPRIIEAGASLGLLLDQRARKKPVMAPFFGREARCDRSAGVLLRRLRCPVVFVGGWRVGDLRWRYRAPSVLWPDEVAGRSPEEVATLVNARLEELLLEDPEQVFWLHDRYR